MELAHQCTATTVNNLIYVTCLTLLVCTILCDSFTILLHKLGNSKNSGCCNNYSCTRCSNATGTRMALSTRKNILRYFDTAKPMPLTKTIPPQTISPFNSVTLILNNNISSVLLFQSPSACPEDLNHFRLITSHSIQKITTAVAISYLPMTVISLVVINAKRSTTEVPKA